MATLRIATAIHHWLANHARVRVEQVRGNRADSLAQAMQAAGPFLATH